MNPRWLAKNGMVGPNACLLSFELLAKDGANGPAFELDVCLISLVLLAKDGINGPALELGVCLISLVLLAKDGIGGPAFCFNFASDFDFDIQHESHIFHSDTCLIFYEGGA